MSSRIRSPPKTSNKYTGDYLQIQHIPAAEIRRKKEEHLRRQKQQEAAAAAAAAAAALDTKNDKEDSDASNQNTKKATNDDKEDSLQFPKVSNQENKRRNSFENNNNDEQQDLRKKADQALLEELMLSSSSGENQSSNKTTQAPPSNKTVSGRKPSIVTGSKPPVVPANSKNGSGESPTAKVEEISTLNQSDLLLPPPPSSSKQTTRRNSVVDPPLSSSSPLTEKVVPQFLENTTKQHEQFIADPQQKARLTKFYSRVAPAKLDSIDTILQKYNGKEDEMWNVLHSRYGPEDEQDQQPKNLEEKKSSSATLEQEKKKNTKTEENARAAFAKHSSSSPQSSLENPFLAAHESLTLSPTHHDKLKSTNDSEEIKPKSLWLALVLKNPFFYAKKKRPHVPPPGSLKGYSPDAATAHAGTAHQNQANMLKKKKKNTSNSGGNKKKASSKNNDDIIKNNSSFFIQQPQQKDDPHSTSQVIELDEATSNFIINETTFLEDDDFLKRPNFLLKKDLDAPNDFQKMIELLLRLKKRQLHVVPSDILVECDSPPPDEPWNFLEGYCLRESRLLLSPDGDEAYFRIHARRQTLTAFAEKQSLTLRSNPYSFAGGVGMVFDRRTDEELAQSVRDYMKHFAIPEADEYCKGKRKESDTAAGTNNEDHQGWGFCLEVPQKMRLVIRLLREGWVFGGAGLQLDEMKELGILVVSYFPLHNEAYLREYEIDKWASFKAMFDSSLVLKENELALIHYFGESVAIYFSWMRQYVLYLIVPAAIGVICGVAMEIEGLPRAAIGGAFAVVIVLYMCSWMRKWQRYEKRFGHRWGQDIEQKQELVRDRFVYERKNIVDVNTIFSMNFEFPLTMHRMSDGTMVELHFPHRRRLMRRYLVSYPIILVVTAIMVAALYYAQRLRFDRPGDLIYSGASSVLSVVIALVFGKIFNVLVQILNLYENARTESENDNELITKSFVFYFISTYFAAFAIALWPSNGTFDESTRLFELKSQLIVQLALLPIVQNVIELALPRFGAIFRRKVDETGGIVNAICALFCCCCPCAPPGSNNDNQYQQKVELDQDGDDDDDNEDQNRQQQRLVDAFGVPMNSTATSTAQDEVNHNNKHKQSATKTPSNEFEEGTIEHKIWSEAQLEPYSNTAEDFLEITLQYGWSVMFAAIFPWAPFLALIFNIIEIRVDAVKLLYFCQRPIAKVSDSIGSWLPILWTLNILAVVTNSYYIIFISDAVGEVGLDTSDEAKLRYFIYSQYFFAIMIAIILAVRGESSPTSKKAQVKTDLLRDRAVQNFVTRSLSADQEELKKQTEERMKRFALVSGGDGGNEDQNPICSVETLMNICLPSFCIPQGEEQQQDVDQDQELHQQLQEPTTSAGMMNTRRNSSPRSSSLLANSSSSAAPAIGGGSSGNLKRMMMSANEIQHELDRQKKEEQEKTLLAISWARLKRREELYEKTVAKNAKSPSSGFQLPKVAEFNRPNTQSSAHPPSSSSYAQNTNHYQNNHHRLHFSDFDDLANISSSMTSPYSCRTGAGGRGSGAALKMLPGETEDEFVDRIIQRDRQQNPFEHRSTRRSSKRYDADDYDL